MSDHGEARCTCTKVPMHFGVREYTDGCPVHGVPAEPAPRSWVAHNGGGGEIGLFTDYASAAEASRSRGGYVRPASSVPGAASEDEDDAKALDEVAVRDEHDTGERLTLEELAEQISGAASEETGDA